MSCPDQTRLQSYKCCCCYFFLPSSSCSRMTTTIIAVDDYSCRSHVMQGHIAETVAVVDTFVTGKDTRLWSYKQRGTRDCSAEGHVLISPPLARLTFVALWWRTLKKPHPSVTHVRARCAVKVRRRKHLLQITDPGMRWSCTCTCLLRFCCATWSPL